MWLIVGLGNPGSRYEETPHNLGFEVVRALARRHGMSWSPSSKVRAEVADGSILGERVHLMMPTTFMNVSGEAVQPYAAYYNIAPENILAISDDVALLWGTLRLRPGGSHGGHNGLRNMILRLGTPDFPRLRIGCAPEGWRGSLVDYVLAKLRGDALQLSQHMAEIGADTIEHLLREGMTKTQEKYNGYRAE